MKILPDETIYFYGYPGAALLDSTEGKPFFNSVPFHTVERKVASRLGTMGVPYLNFHSNSDKTIREVYDCFNFQTDKEQFFSPEIENFSTLLEKDTLIKNELIKNFADKRIYQAQAYSDTQLKSVYDPSSLISIDLNDKSFLKNWIPVENLLEHSETPFSQYPFIGKLSRSSAGDGTDVLKNEEELKAFQLKFEKISSKIPLYYEKFQDGKEYGIEFFRSHEGTFDIISIIESLVDENSSYAGGLITPDNKTKITPNIQKLMKHVEQYLTSVGWYGRGGLDIIVANDSQVFVIDPNIRVTQIMPAAWDTYKHPTNLSACYSSFKINCEHPNRRKNLHQAVKSGIMKGYSGTIYQGTLYGDGSVMFDQTDTMKENKEELRKKGILFTS